MAGLKENHFDETQLKKAIRIALTAVHLSTSEILNQSLGTYSQAPPLLRIISPLADGADRFVAKVALENKDWCDLQCPLPFPAKAYRRTFDETESKKEFCVLLAKSSSTLELDGQPHSSESRELAYQKLGQVALKYSDILLAIWDGNPPEGKGGTGEVVEAALRQGIPVLWIEASQPHRVCLYEPNKPYQWNNLSELPSRLKPIFTFPSESEAVRFRDFLQEKSPTFTTSITMTTFTLRKWHSVRPSIRLKRFRLGRIGDWNRSWRHLSKLTGGAERERLRRFLRVDRLAELFANRYRNSLVALYVLGALAVLFAFLGYHTKIYGWYITELTLIMAIIALTRFGHHRRWHEKWMDYRLLAEGLRQLRILAPIARAVATLTVPDEPDDKNRTSSWVNWYLGAITREASIPDCKLDQDFLLRYRGALGATIQAQEDYHEKNVKELEDLHHTLHSVTQRLFWLAAFACTLHLMPVLCPNIEIWLHHHNHFHRLAETGLNICVIVLPIFGAAIGAILHQREFEWTALRSNAQKKQLEQIMSRLPKRDEVTSPEELGDIAEEFSKLLMTELSDWGLVFRRRDLSLPS